jgi:arylsulfatase A-like enzyme
MKQSLYEHSARNPLIVSAPGAAQNAMNTRVVEYLDLYPTLLDLAGFPVSSRLEGRSLKPLLSNPAHKWDDFAITQVIRGGGGRRGGDGEGAAGGGRGRGAGQGRRGGGAGGAQQAFMGYSIRTTQWRYTEWDGGAQGTELYDEINDPGEVLNLASDPKYADVVKTLKARIPKRPRVEAGDMRAILQRIRTVVD